MKQKILSRPHKPTGLTPMKAKKASGAKKRLGTKKNQ